MADIDTERSNLVAAALSLAASWLHHEANPGDPHGEDQIDLNTEILDQAVDAYVGAHETERPSIHEAVTMRAKRLGLI